MKDNPAKGRITPSFRPSQVEKAAPCQVSCANCGDIRGWIGEVAQRKKLGISRHQAFARAWQVIADVNPFPATLGRICPHPCESHCNRSGLDEPLAINALERFLGDFAIQQDLPLSRQHGRQAGDWLGVVGAGPSGLSFAYQMSRRGYRVTVYDAREAAGGMLRYGVPDFRLPHDILDAEIRKILDLGVELELNTRVGRDISLQELRSRHSSLYIGIGAQKGKRLRIPGSDHPNVLTGTDFLDRVNHGETMDTGSHVIVVGGGNTAVDAARCARRSGADVHILYRRTRDEMPAISQEVDDALEEGISIDFLCAPESIEHGTNGRLAGVRVQRMRLGEPDASGRPRPLVIPGSVYTLEADMVIAAVSQVPVLEGLESLGHEGNWLVADVSGAVSGHTLVGGDAMGLGIAGGAILQGRQAAEALHEKLQGAAGEPIAQTAYSPIMPDKIRFASKPESEAAHTPKLPGEEGVALGMKEMTGTITEEEFLHEVDRCYSCGSCFGCEQCYMYCTADCFTRVEEPRPGMYFTLNLDACHECGKCIEVCPCGFLEVS